MLNERCEIGPKWDTLSRAAPIDLRGGVQKLFGGIRKTQKVFVACSPGSERWEQVGDVDLG
jgi:hypothetical protein